MDNPNAILLIITLILVLIFLVFSRRRREARRADYNRKIGQPDLAAPMPSEAQATQRSIRGLLILVVVLIILGFLFSPVRHLIF